MLTVPFIHIHHEEGKCFWLFKCLCWTCLLYQTWKRRLRHHDRTDRMKNDKKCMFYFFGCFGRFFLPWGTIFDPFEVAFPGIWSRPLNAHTTIFMSCLSSLQRWDDAPREGLALTDNNISVGLFPWGLTGISFLFLTLVPSQKSLSAASVQLLHWDISADHCVCHPSSRKSHCSTGWQLLFPEPGWMTFRRPPPLRLASVVQPPVSPKWSCVCLAKLCWIETHWTSLTPVSPSWYRPMDSGQRWASFLFDKLLFPLI